jgi:ankyrin repeat protein
MRDKKRGPSEELELALTAHDLPRIRALLASGADPNVSTSDVSPLLDAFASDPTWDDPAPLELLLDAGARVDKTVDGGTRTALSEAALQNKPRICAFLIERGASIHFAKKGRGVLHAAAQGGVLWLVERILAEGGKARIADEDGETPLHDACFAGHLTIATRLLDAGADVNAAVKSGDYKGMTPLKLAVLGGCPKLTELLLERGAEMPAASHPLLALLKAPDLDDDDNDDRDDGDAEMLPIPEEIKQDIAAMITAHARGEEPRPSYERDGFAQAAAVVLKRSGALPKKVIQAAERKLKRQAGSPIEDAIKKNDARAVADLHKKAKKRGDEDASLLHLAASHAGPDVIRALLDAGEKPSAFSPYEGTPLHSAVRAGNRAVVEALLQAGVNINRWSEPEGQDEPESALAIASAGDDLPMVKLLLKHGASPDFPPKIAKWQKEYLADFLPIMRATSPAVIKALLAAGADPNVCAPVVGRVEDGHIESVRALLEGGADPNKEGMDGERPLVMALSGGHVEMARLLLKHGATLGKHKPPQGLGPELKRLLVEHEISPVPKKPSFRDAIEYGLIDKVLAFIKRGEDVNKKNKEKDTPLVTAIAAGQDDVALLLLEHGANPTPKIPYPPIYAACVSDNERLAGELLKRGADPNLAVDSVLDKETLLHASARNGNVGIVKLLLDAGADVNGESENGETALFPAAYWARPELVRLLIARGADVSRIDKNGHSVLRNCFWGRECDASDEALYLETLAILLDAGAAAGTLASEAAERDHLKTLEVLAKKGALDPNRREENSEPPLYEAARSGNAEVTRFLLEHGADPTARSSRLFGGKLWTALHAAAANEHANVVRVLVERGAPLDARDGDGQSPLDVAKGRDVRELLRRAGAASGRRED